MCYEATPSSAKFSFPNGDHYRGIPLLFQLQVVESGQQCLSGGYVDLTDVVAAPAAEVSND